MNTTKIIDGTTWEVIEEENNMNKGKLVTVELGPRRSVKMYEADAIAQGHIPAPKEQKQKAPAGDKRKKPTGNKSLETKELPADDFTEISGVGPATARALQARNIRTFEDLRHAGDLNFLSETIRKHIEEWRG